MFAFKRCFIGGIIYAALFAMPTCNAQESEIYLIEEDWELVLNEPDAVNVSPQVTLFTSPSVNSEDSYFQLQMNYAADDVFSSGGFHVAAVQNGQIVDEARSATCKILSHDGDTIRWTNVMAVLNNKVFYAITHGQRQDWGDFGGPDYLVELHDNDAHDLAEYHTNHSLESVDIGFGANRVADVD